MSFAVVALFAWLVLIVFAIVPKGLKLTEIVFLYFLAVIITITLFTILDVNLHWVPLTRNVEGSFAIYICRFILIPFQILLSVCVLNSKLKVKWRVVLTGASLLFLCVADRFYLWADLITFRRWNELYSAIMYGVFIAMIWGLARWFVGLDRIGSE